MYRALDSCKSILFRVTRITAENNQPVSQRRGLHQGSGILLQGTKGRLAGETNREYDRGFRRLVQ